MPYVRILPENKIIKVIQGKRLLDILIENNIKIPSYCGGAGWCGKCKVKILDKRYKPCLSDVCGRGFNN
jgi:ferredoxin